MNKKKAPPKKKTSYTMMFIPEDNGKTFSLRINRASLRAVVFCFILFGAGIVVLLLKTGEIGAKLQLVESIRHENARLKMENRKLRLITAKLHSMQNLSAYLHRLAVNIGEDTTMPPLATLLGAANDAIYSEDSLDTFLKAVQFAKSEEYKEHKASSSDPSQILSAIPNILPVEGWITRGFSPSAGLSTHNGVDFAAAEGTLIRASAPGFIDAIVHDKYFGLLITVKHSYGFETRYGHCLQVLVAEGDHVERGQTIAFVGNTGRSSGPHLHYEVHKNGKPVDPLNYTLDRSLVK